MEGVGNISEEAHAYISAIDRRRWANAFVEGHRYDIITTNIAECTNNLVKEIRELPITKQVKAILVKLMHFYETRHELSCACKTHLSPWAEKFLAKEA